MVPPVASTNRRVSVAIPERRCRKLSAVRSAVSIAAAVPRTSATTVPGVQRSPSPRATVNSAPGSSCRNASAATSRPAMTQSDLARITPRARSDESIVASVVTSPHPRSSARARRTVSRYSAGSSGANGTVFTARVPPGRFRPGARVTSTCSIAASSVSSRWISPDARKSASTDGSSASIAPGALTTTSDTGVLSGRCSSDFFFLIVPRTVAANRSASTPSGYSAPPQVDSTSSAVGHCALWTDPSRHHDQTSSVTNGRNGANRRSIVESAISSVAFADAASSVP